MVLIFKTELKMIDTYTPLFRKFDEDRTEMIKRAINKGVTEFYLTCHRFRISRKNASIRN